MVSSILCISSSERVPPRLNNRNLLTVVSWSAMDFASLPSKNTNTSLGYRRPVLLVSGITCTRLRNLFEPSLLTITAGRFFLISPPTDGSKFTHQTSPLFIFDIFKGSFSPLKSLLFPFSVFRHFFVS